MSDNLLQVYSRAPVEFVRGEGSWLYDRNGEAYLDCVSGIATNALGHANPDLIEALTEQADKIWHLSNVFRIPGQEELAKRLTDATFADAAFFCNSGSEAVECAIKMARKYHSSRGQEDRVDIIGFSGSFHGRTSAALNASGNANYLEGFGPRLPGFVQLELDDLQAIERQIKQASTAALIVEPVQGEGGARPIAESWLRQIRAWCSDAGVLLIYDEIQSGMGRTGKLFAHQWFDRVEPDIMTVAKALGGGFPVGACLATAKVSEPMGFGTHGSTFGGNPLAMAVANRAFDLINSPSRLHHVQSISEVLREGLCEVAESYPSLIEEVRGKGLLIGVRMRVNNRQFMVAARSQKLLIAGGGENCVRLLPALNISLHDAKEVLIRFRATCEAEQSSENVKAA